MSRFPLLQRDPEPDPRWNGMTREQVAAMLAEIAFPDLVDVDESTAPEDGWAPIWDASSGKYVPGPVSGGGGAVASVNGQTGVVVLDAADVGADPAGTAASAVTGLQHTDEKNQPGGYAGLDGDGLLATSTLPALAIGDTFTADNEIDMLALSAQRGDLAIRTDTDRVYRLVGPNPALLSDWVLLPVPSDAVQSINGQTGIVNLGAADVGADPAGSADALADSLGSAAFVALLDEDDMASDSATDVPSQQSVKAFVLANAGGGGGLQVVRAATTGNVTLSGTQTIDGVALVAGDPVLVKNQTTTTQNGVYEVAAGAWALVDWDGADITMIVAEGTVNGGHIYTNASNVDPLARSVPASQVTGVLDPARIPDIDASKLATGTLDLDRLNLGKGRPVIAAPSTNFPSAGGYFPLAETIPHTVGATTIANQTGSLATGRLHLIALPLIKGMPINSICFFSGTTALATGTHQWFSLWSENFTCLAVTTNDTNTAWAANTLKVLPLAGSATYTVGSTGIYYVGIMIAATTVPTLRGTSIGSTTVRARSLVADTGLTTPVSPGFIATPTAMHTVLPYAWVGGAA